MSHPQFDVVVIGAGPGGYVSAIRAAQMGFKTAIIEGHKMGGECLNYGCIPSKALITAGHLVDRLHHAAEMGINAKELNVDLKKLIQWKGSVVNKLTTGVSGLLKANKVEVFKGTGSFHSLSSDGRIKKIKIDESLDSYDLSKTSQQGTKEIEAHRVVIASGSISSDFPALKFNGKSILSSKQALDVTQIPKKIIVVGGGVIGLEIGTFFAHIGTEVVVVEATPNLLPGTDKECVAVIEKKLKSKGVKIFTETKALGVEERGAKGNVLHIEGKDGKKFEESCDWVLLTVGRKPRTHGLNLDAIQLTTNQRGFIEVNDRLQTKVDGIYAIGDVVPGPMLAHKASKEGLIAAETMKNPGVRMDIQALPWAIFCDPEIAGVGHSLESAKEAGWDPVTAKCPFGANGRALTTGDADGFVKIICDRKSDRMLGAHMVGPEVSNLVAEVAVAIEMQATAQDLGRIVHAHPTLPEAIMEAAEAVHGMAIHIYSPKK